MKKLLFVLALGAFAACNNGSDSSKASDSTATTVDSTAGAAKDSVNAMADTAKKSIDSTAKAAKDSIKKK